MTAPHFEVVRSEYNNDPWHARYVINGRIVWSTEQYTRMVGAERAILSVARAFGYVYPELVWNAPPVEKLLRDAPPGRWKPWLSVLYVDERLQ